MKNKADRFSFKLNKTGKVKASSSCGGSEPCSGCSTHKPKPDKKKCKYCGIIKRGKDGFFTHKQGCWSMTFNPKPDTRSWEKDCYYDIPADKSKTASLHCKMIKPKPDKEKLLELITLASKITSKDINHKILHKKHIKVGLKQMVTCEICNPKPDKKWKNCGCLCCETGKYICIHTQLQVSCLCKNNSKDKNVKIEEKSNPDGPLGWIMTLNNQGQLTVYMGSALSYKIQEAFGVKHERNVFINSKLK